jgi:hypothetical protein
MRDRVELTLGRPVLLYRGRRFMGSHTETRWKEIRVSAADDDDQSAPRLIVSCRNCEAEETMNDEEGGCPLADLAAWATRHQCRRPISYISVGDLVTPVDETASARLERPHRRSVLRGELLRASKPTS